MPFFWHFVSFLVFLIPKTTIIMLFILTGSSSSQNLELRQNKSRQNIVKTASKKVFRHFLKLGSLLFHEVEHDDSLQQCIKSSRGLAQTIFSSASQTTRVERNFRWDLSLDVLKRTWNLAHKIWWCSAVRTWSLG